jgi:hypothetical protein
VFIKGEGAAQLQCLVENLAASSPSHGFDRRQYALAGTLLALPLCDATQAQAPAAQLCMCAAVLLPQYGLMSNLDVGTEHLRWMGDTRFLLGLLWVSGHNPTAISLSSNI